MAGCDALNRRPYSEREDLFGSLAAAVSQPHAFLQRAQRPALPPLPSSSQKGSMVAAFSEAHAGGLVKFSPSGSYIASAAGFRLILRDVDTLEIVQLFSCIDTIEGLQWSCDSEYVLCSIQKRGAAQVALAADADIVPVTIRCEPMTLTKSEPWYRIPARRPHWTLSVGQAFPARVAPWLPPPQRYQLRRTPFPRSPSRSSASHPMRTKQEIFNYIQDVLVDLFEIDRAKINLDAQLYQDLDIDSIDAIDLVLQLKEVTGKKIRPEEFKDVRTVADVVDAVQALMSDLATET